MTAAPASSSDSGPRAPCIRLVDSITCDDAAAAAAPSATAASSCEGVQRTSKTSSPKSTSVQTSVRAPSTGGSK